jgi:UDP-4-amino-4,6-dideoxy-N-acetyl-beta-L-altrosamine transaminase
VIPYGKQDISDDDIASVVNVLRSPWLTQGPIVPSFEEALADYCKVENVIALSSATAALHVACLALGVGPKDLVWTSPITFVASANCARFCGADVDFVDIDPRTYNISVEKLADKLVSARKKGRLPSLIIPVHLCGQSCDMEAIHTLSREFGFRIIEDASHAVGGAYLGERIGCCRYSDITVFSFHPVKIITTGEGGAATTSDGELARRMKLYRSHGLERGQPYRSEGGLEEIWNYEQVLLGYNYRMPDLNAALGLSQITQLNDFLVKRRSIAKRYDEALSNLPIILPWQDPKSRSSYHLYPIRISPKLSTSSQLDVYKKLRAAGIEVNLHYIPVYLQPYYRNLGFTRGYCPDSETYFREAISIPIFPSLTEEEQSHVISSISEALVV